MRTERWAVTGVDWTVLFVIVSSQTTTMNRYALKKLFSAMFDDSFSVYCCCIILEKLKKKNH